MEPQILCMENPHRTARPSSPMSARIAASDLRRSAAAFHESVPGYAPTPLVRLRVLADLLGIGELWVKDESSRLGLNAFKVLGAGHAVARILAKRLGMGHGHVAFSDVASRPEVCRGLTLVTATDGNHGRAVAWAADTLGCRAVVYMPEGSSQVRLEAVLGHGAEASIIDGTYDDAVRLAARKAEEEGWIVVQDTSWHGYEEIPLLIMQGYTVLMEEVFGQLKADRPTHVFVQAGVGSFAASVEACLCERYGEERPFLVVVEPTGADCFYRSAANREGSRQLIQGRLPTMMAGLACGEPNPIAWDLLRDHADAFVACSDRVAGRGMRVLGNPLGDDPRVVSGESGAVTTGLLYELLMNPRHGECARRLRLGPESKVLTISTEGDTDPDHYRQVVWGSLEAPPAGVGSE